MNSSCCIGPPPFLKTIPRAGEGWNVTESDVHSIEASPAGCEGVLDVAGGRGELAFSLQMLHGIRATGECLSHLACCIQSSCS